MRCSALSGSSDHSREGTPSQRFNKQGRNSPPPSPPTTHHTLHTHRPLLTLLQWRCSTPRAPWAAAPGSPSPSDPPAWTATQSRVPGSWLCGLRGRGGGEVTEALIPEQSFRDCLRSMYYTRICAQARMQAWAACLPLQHSLSSKISSPSLLGPIQSTSCFSRLRDLP